VIPHGDTGARAIEQLRDLRLVKNTKNGYKSKIKIITNHFLSEPAYQQFVSGPPIRELILPLPQEVILNLFGWLSSNPDLPKRPHRRGVADDEAVMDGAAGEGGAEEESDEDEPHPPNPIEDIFDRVTIAVSTLQGYKSALKNFYSQHKVLFEKDLDKQLDEVIKGYKRLITQKKAAGVMDANEGKLPFSYSGLRGE
jgi:hypothetical protein